MIKPFFISTFILLSAVIIESSILSNISFLLVVPDLVLICSIYFSLLNGKFFGETQGFISGLFLDFYTGIPCGFNCLYRTIIGYVYGFFSESIILKGIFMPVLTVGIGTIVKALLIHLTALLFPNTDVYVTSILSYKFLFELLANIILAPIIFRFLNLFIKSLCITSTKDKVDNV